MISGGTRKALVALAVFAASLMPANRATVEPPDPRIPHPIAEALQLAESEQTYLFVEFVSADCDACKTLAENTLVDDRVREELDRFVYLIVDVDRSAEACQFYGIEQAPAMMALDHDGTERFRWWGDLDPADLLHLLRTRTPPRARVDPALSASSDADGRPHLPMQKVLNSRS